MNQCPCRNFVLVEAKQVKDFAIFEGYSFKRLDVVEHILGEIVDTRYEQLSQHRRRRPSQNGALFQA